MQTKDPASQSSAGNALAPLSGPGNAKGAICRAKLRRWPAARCPAAASLGSSLSFPATGGPPSGPSRPYYSAVRFRVCLSVFTLLGLYSILLGLLSVLVRVANFCLALFFPTLPGPPSPARCPLRLFFFSSTTSSLTSSPPFSCLFPRQPQLSNPPSTRRHDNRPPAQTKRPQERRYRFFGTKSCVALFFCAASSPLTVVAARCLQSLLLPSSSCVIATRALLRLGFLLPESTAS